MRLKILKSKNPKLFYIIKDYTKNGKRSTKIVKRTGNLEDIKIMAGNQDYKAWLKEYVKDYNKTHCKSETIITHKTYKNKVKIRVMSLFKIGLTLFHLALNSRKYIRLPITFTLYDI